MKLQFEKLDSIKLVAMLLAVLTFVVAIVCKPLTINAAWEPRVPTDYLYWLWQDGGSVKDNQYLFVHSNYQVKFVAYFDYNRGRRIIAYSEQPFYCGWESSDVLLNTSLAFDMTFFDSRSSTIDGKVYYYYEDSGMYYNGSYAGIGDGNCLVMRSQTLYGQVKTIDLLTYAITGRYPDGFEVEDVGGKETIDDELIIHNLESYENRDSVVTGLTTYVTWDALGGNDYDPSNLYLEAKVNFSTQNKRTGDKKSYADVPLKSMEDGVKDTAGKFSFVNYNFLADYCDANGIDDTNLLYITDNIYCRYAYDGPEGIVYGEWQRVGDVVPTIDDADYSQDIELDNLRYKELQPATGMRQHYVSFDIKDGYDASTYLLVSADIKWKPALNKTNVATYVPIVEKKDKYLASSGEWSIDVDTLWKNYFDAEGINYSAFTSQWADKLYFQVVKWSEIDNKWYSSNLYAVDLNQQTTGVVGNIREVNPGRFDKETGSFIEGKYDNSGTFVPGKDGSYFVDGSTGEVVEKEYGGIFDGMELPEGSSVLDYITALGTALISGISSLLSAVGQVPKMIGAVISFLPGTLITLIGIGLVIAIVLRILGR